MSDQNDKVAPLINKKILVGCLIIIVIGVVFIGISLQSKTSLSSNKTTTTIPPDDNDTDFPTIIEGKQESVYTTQKDLLFNIKITFYKNDYPLYVNVEKKPELSDFYKQVGYPSVSNDAVVIYPIFTQGAYGNNGFYDYYNKKCDSKCLTLSIPNKFVPTYASSMTASIVLSILNYSYITDVQVDKNPDILKKYHKVIVLHNESVTKKDRKSVV